MGQREYGLSEAIPWLQRIKSSQEINGKVNTNGEKSRLSESIKKI